MIIKSEHVRTDLLPYDFVRTNEVIVIEEEDEYLIISTKNLSMQTYHELQRHLCASFEFKICDSTTFNEVLTTSFSTTNHNNDISEELSDEFDIQDFAGSINTTEDLLSGNNDVPIIKLINGIISQAIKNRASDIHFEPYEDHIVVRYRIDGILKEILKQDSKIASVLISRIKIISGLEANPLSKATNCF